MINPNEIEMKKFKKVVLGYSAEEVDRFLDAIYSDYERLYRKNIELQDKIGMLNQGRERYHSIEKTLEKTLYLAEQTAEETKEAARAAAEQIERGARLQAEEMLNFAKAKSFGLEQEIARLENSYELMRNRVKLLLYAEIDLIEKDDIFSKKEAGLENKQ